MQLSTAMLECLRQADENHFLVCTAAGWTYPGVEYHPRNAGRPYRRPFWSARQATINALTTRGLLRHDGPCRRIITPEGWAALTAGAVHGR